MYPTYPNYQNFPTRPNNNFYPQVPSPQFQTQANFPLQQSVQTQFQNPSLQTINSQNYPNSIPQNPQVQVSSAEKRTKILELYKIILGRIPKEADISTLLSNNLSEIELMKKMLNSEEHLEILNSRNEIVNSRIETEKIKKEMEDIKARQMDLENTNKSWEELVSEKSDEMRKLEEEKKILSEKIENMRKRIEGYEVRLNKPMWKKGWEWVRKVWGR